MRPADAEPIVTYQPQPGPQPPIPRRKLLDAPIIIAVVVVLALAVAVVVVLSTKKAPGGAPHGQSSSSSDDLNLSSSSGAPPSPDSSDIAVTASEGIAFTLAADATSKSASGSWSGPGSGKLGGYALTETYTLPACAASKNGADVFLGVTTDPSTDLATAATNVVKGVGSALFTETYAPAVGTVATEDHTINGSKTTLAEADVKLSKADPCGTDLFHVGALAVTNASGQTAVLLVSYRVSGSGLTVATYQQTLVTVLQSMTVS